MRNDVYNIYNRGIIRKKSHHYACKNIRNHCPKNHPHQIT
ncbi:MAG: hypothetical protein IJS33_02140 [Firmicutes bacterium]|nr:hypothetical protein [Bacillota bacterium]